MIEVMVAVFVVAFGLLALTGLQVVSKRNALDAAQHTVAAQLANDLFERMRANRSPQGLGSYLNTAAAGLGRGQQGDEPVPNCRDAQCNAAQLAQHDLWAWEQALDGAAELIGDAEDGERTAGLINAEACLDGPIGGGMGIYTLTIAWRGSVPLPAVADEPCGLDLGLYGDADEFRRILQFAAFITN
jgi:type IV pilus assembly protein PilV